MPKCPHCQGDIQVQLRAGFAKGNDGVASPPGDLQEAQNLMDTIDPVTLNDFETKFYNDMKEKLEKYKDRAMISEKQVGVIRRMASKGF
jgi:hypothetical protein